MKKCAKCEIEKPYTEFRKHKRNKDGYQYYCKLCQNQMAKDSRKTIKKYTNVYMNVASVFKRR